MNKFINREQTYSELLISIADYERKIDELKKTNDKLKADIHALKEKNLPTEKVKGEKTEKNDTAHDIIKELAEKNESYQKAKLVLEKTYTWAIKTLLKLDKVVISSFLFIIKAQNVMKNNYAEMYPKEKVVDAFVKVLENIKTHLAAIKEQVYSNNYWH